MCMSHVDITFSMIVILDSLFPLFSFLLNSVSVPGLVKLCFYLFVFNHIEIGVAVQNFV